MKNRHVTVSAVLVIFQLTQTMPVNPLDAKYESDTENATLSQL